MTQQNLFQLSGIDQVIPVHGLEGAQAYSMGPNCRVPLFDDSENVFYIKSTDANGFPTLKTYDFTERVVVDETKFSLNDIRSIIRDELSSIREELTHGQQFVSEPKYTAAESSSVNTSGSNGSAATKYNRSATYPKQSKPRTNSSNVENGEE